MDGGAAGTMRVTQPRYASDFPRSLTAHDIALRDLIESAALLGPLPTMFLVTVSIDTMQSMETRLSPAVEASVVRTAEAVLQLVAQIDIARPSA